MVAMPARKNSLRLRLSRAAAIGLSSAVLLGALGCAAHADTDYKCLSDCLGNGGVGSRCLASCTYQPMNGVQLWQMPPDQAAIMPQSRHSQFFAPVQTDQLTTGSDAGPSHPPYSTPTQQLSPTVQPLGPSTNFKCVRTCLDNHYQHDLCMESCSY